MRGPLKPRRLDEPIAVSLEELVPADHFYHHRGSSLDLGFVRDWTHELYAHRGRSSIDPIVHAASSSLVQDSRHLGMSAHGAEWLRSGSRDGSWRPCLGLGPDSSGGERGFMSRPTRVNRATHRECGSRCGPRRRSSAWADGRSYQCQLHLAESRVTLELLDQSPPETPIIRPSAPALPGAGVCPALVKGPRS